MEDGSDHFIIHERYKIIRHIGSGSSGTVYSAYDQQSQTFCAIKKIYNIFPNNNNKTGSASTSITKRCLREIKCLHQFHGHPRIIDLLDLNLVNDDLYLIFQCMDTSLHDVIHSQQPLYDIHFQWILYQLFSGLHYIHSAHIIHRDLTPANILINKDCQIKIGDFGMARGYPVNHNHKNIYLTEYVCTRWYRAPEIILNTGYYDQQIDTWSLGCIFGELLGRKVLFQGKDHVDQLQVIMKKYGLSNNELFSSSSSSPNNNLEITTTKDMLTSLYQEKKQQSFNQFQELFPTCTPLGIDLLNQLLQLDPEKRITMEKALEHPFVTIFSDPEEESLHCPPFHMSFDSCQLENKSMARQLVLDQIDFFKQYYDHNQHQNEIIHPPPPPPFPSSSSSTTTSTSKLLLDDNNNNNNNDNNHPHSSSSSTIFKKNKSKVGAISNNSLSPESILDKTMLPLFVSNTSYNNW
ncbi:kinase-like domain-containing protein [Cunninghamella echinulata]|nr:kinase-like domain-containing protein [Cunninghamella echinulata]